MGKKSLSFLSYLLLFTAIIFNPFGSNPFELIKLHYLSILISLILIIIIFFFIFKKKLRFNFNKIIFLLLSLWGLSLLLSTILSIAPGLSFWGSYSRFQGGFSHIFYILTFIIVYQVYNTQKKQEVFLKALVNIGLIVSIHALLQKIGILTFSQEAIDQFLGRSYSFFGHPNFLGQFLIFPIFASLYFLSKKYK